MPGYYFPRYADTRRQAPSRSVNRDAWRNRPATERQVNFVLTLQANRVCEPFSREALNQMTGGVVSELIDQLKRAPIRQEPTPASAPRLDFAPMVSLFRAANQHLKWPKVRLQTASGQVVILSLAGERSRNAGAIYVKGEGRFGEAPYYGKINPDGSFNLGGPSDLMPLLRRFSADPATVAAEYGRLTGNCCFCSRELTDERSTSVGYGPVCAGHYGLPWGNATPLELELDQPVSFGEELGMDVS